MTFDLGWPWTVLDWGHRCYNSNVSKIVRDMMSNENTFLYVIMTQLFTRVMPFTYEDKGFVKMCRIVCIAPKPGFEPGWLPCVQGLCRTQFPAWTISKTECALAGRILTNRWSTNLLITGVTNWRLWFDWIVDTLNSCFAYLVHWLPCCVM